MNIRRIAVIFCLMISSISIASDNSDSMYEIRAADILHSKLSGDGWSARVTLRIPKEIPLKYWVNCDYYDNNSEVIASTRHVLKERVPTWTVKADHKDIYFALCSVPS